jgi:hypothetical protein
MASSALDASEEASSLRRSRSDAGMGPEITANCKLGQHVFMLQSAPGAEVAEWQTQRIQNPPSERV